MRKSRYKGEVDEGSLSADKTAPLLLLCTNIQYYERDDTATTVSYQVK